MKRVNIGFCIAILVAVLVSCQANNKERKMEGSDKNMLSTEKIDTNERQFVCKATMDMQVKNCLATTNLIEQKVISQKGFILKSDVKKLNSSIAEKVINVDSLQQITTYNTTADIIVRVPDTALQAMLQYTESLGEHVTARIISAADVTFDLKLNALNRKSNEGQTAVVTNEETAATEKKVLSKNESIIEHMRMKDEVHFSTVKITLQQPEEILTTVIVNTNATWAKGNNAFGSAWLNIQKGFYVVSSIVVFLLQFWWVPILFFLGKWSYGRGKKYFSRGEVK
jgi:hypothetical protein